jgi:hypothetical protein
MEAMRPYIVTSWGRREPQSPEIKALLKKLGADADGGLGWSNAYVAILDARGEPVHAFDGAQAGVSGRRDPNARPDYLAEEFVKGWAKLDPAPPAPKPKPKSLTLPDVRGPESPAGVRLFSRSAAPGFGDVVTVRTAPMSPEQRRALAYPAEARSIEAQTLRSWLELLQLPRVRETDANTPFDKIEGSLKLQSAGTDGKSRTATWTGSIELTKKDGFSSAELTFEAVVFYAPDRPEPRSVRGVLAGTYRYRLRGEDRTTLKMSAALESRPE